MKSLELFSGVGGMALGLEAAGFKHLDLVESDEFCVATLNRNIRKGLLLSNGMAASCVDIHDYDFRPLEDQLWLLSGGPPCQPFSLGGSHRAALDPRNMFPQALRAVREARPKAFLFENVPGLLRPRFRNYFEYLRLCLSFPEISELVGETWEEHHRRLERYQTSSVGSGCGYRVISQLINVADFGVPQRRSRVFLVGIRDDLKIGWSFPSPTHSHAALNIHKLSGEYYDRHRIKPPEMDANQLIRQENKFLDPELLPWVTLRDALSDLPDPEMPGENNHIEGHEFKPGARIYKGHTGSDLDLPSKTLKAGVNGVPGGENMLVKDCGSVRYLTIRECARVQTFPDNYSFHEIWSRAVRQLGNAVPMKIATILGMSLKKALISRT
uniref:DNA cytosine methyltransferase n=1 Tax=Pararhizobium sp. IMCC3301 TaxID=3067904 RepID=UPI0027424FDB|nr:DNA cytosine methyltransferase [Pararhizobium sp. IMCC3301]